jgi:hypothetical protein
MVSDAVLRLPRHFAQKRIRVLSGDQNFLPHQPRQFVSPAKESFSFTVAVVIDASIHEMLCLKPTAAVLTLDMVRGFCWQKVVIPAAVVADEIEALRHRTYGISAGFATESCVDGHGTSQIRKRRTTLVALLTPPLDFSDKPVHLYGTLHVA